MLYIWYNKHDIHTNHQTKTLQPVLLYESKTVLTDYCFYYEIILIRRKLKRHIINKYFSLFCKIYI